MCFNADYPEVVVLPAPENAMSFDGTGPRLMITHIVNENFKSYAGIETLGPFHKVGVFHCISLAAACCLVVGAPGQLPTLNFWLLENLFLIRKFLSH